MLKPSLKPSWFLVLLVVLLASFAEAQIICLSEENRIQLCLDHLKKAIQKTDTLQVDLMLGSQIQIRDKTVDPRPQIRSVFARAGKRKTEIARPANAGDRDFWDFDITILGIVFAQDSTEAVATCQLKLWAARTGVPGKVRQVSDSFRFQRVGGGWKLVAFDNLLDFLGEEVNLRELD